MFVFHWLKGVYGITYLTFLVMVHLSFFLFSIAVNLDNNYQWEGFQLQTPVHNVNNEIRVIKTIQNVNLQTCIEHCQQRQICQFISYHMQTNICFLIEKLSQSFSDGNKVTAANFVFGSKSAWKDVFPSCNVCSEREVCTIAEDGEIVCTINECAEPPVIADAKWIGNKFTVGSRLLYHCSNFMITRTVVCQNNGMWSTFELTCPNSEESIGQSISSPSTVTLTASNTTEQTLAQTTNIAQTTTITTTTEINTIPDTTTGQTITTTTTTELISTLTTSTEQTTTTTSTMGQLTIPSTTMDQTTSSTAATGQTHAPTSTMGQTNFPTTTTGLTSIPTTTTEITTSPTTTMGHTTTPNTITEQTTNPTSTTAQTTTQTSTASSSISTTGQPTYSTTNTGQTTTPTTTTGQTTGQTTTQTATMGQTTSSTTTTRQTTTPTTTTTGQTTTPITTTGQTTTPTTTTTGQTTSSTTTTGQTTTPTTTTGQTTTPTTTTGQTTTPTTTTEQTTTPTTTTGQTTTPTTTTGQTTTPTTTTGQTTSPTTTTGQTTTPTTTTGQTTTPTTTTGQTTTPTTTMGQATTSTTTTGQTTTPTTTTGQTSYQTTATSQPTSPTTTTEQTIIPTTTTGQTTSPTTTAGQTTTPTTTTRQTTTLTTATGQTTTPTTTTRQTTTPTTTTGQTTVLTSSISCPIDTTGQTISYESVHLSDGTQFQYLVVNEPVTQSNALLCCKQSYDGSLVKILTAAKMNFLMENLREQNYEADFWIDAIHTDGVWLTSDEQIVLSESNYWNGGGGINGDDGEACTRMAGWADFKLDDKECTYQYSFICEKTSEPTTTPPICPIVTTGQTFRYNYVTLSDDRPFQFLVVNEPVTQANALLCCTQSYDGSLVKILTAEKMIFLMEYLQDKDSGDDYWIDAKKIDGFWETSDEEAVLSEDTVYWNNQHTSDTSVCTRLKYAINYLLNDRPCDKSFAFICEKS